ncbi:hypothetical protein DH2020_007271 [Rehmannia glutinosa]|uniref:RNase H type-1 domain-containing protein n=1 Tax=Rehmannia glutinosa TaxID=99300 RepID=A0ABR0TYC5_REHGL
MDKRFSHRRIVAQIILSLQASSSLSWRGDFSAGRKLGIRVKQGQHCTTRCIKVTWRVPDMGWFKLNIDGASRGNPGLAGCGGVIRDTQATIIAGFSTFIDVASNVQAELRAILLGLELCQSLHLENIWIETDSLTSIQLLANPPPFSWVFQDVVLRIQWLMSQLRVKISHIYREGNAVADFLANMAIDKCLDSIFDNVSFPKQAACLASLDYLPSFRVL